jgi:hypothetical protein
LRHHAREAEGLLEVEEARVLVGLGRLQDLLEEGLFVVAVGHDCLVLRGQIPDARRYIAASGWGGILHGHVGLLLDDVVVFVVLVFLVGGEGLVDRVGLPRLVVVVEGGPTAGGVLPGEEVVPELAVPVLAVVPHHLGEIPDAAAYLRI